MTLPKAISDAIEAHQKAVSECQTIRYTKFGKECIGEARAALERAIADDRLRQVHAELLCASAQADVAGYLAQRMREVLADHVSPVDAPTEAEIEAWKVCAMGWSVDKAKEPPILQPQPDDVGKDGEAFLVVRSEIEEAVALMRRAAAAKPFYDPTGKGGTHDFAMHIDPAGTVRGVTFTLTDKTTGVVTRYVPEQAAATPAPSAFDRLRERVQLVAGGRDEKKRLIWDEATRGAMQRVLDWIDEDREREAKR